MERNESVIVKNHSTLHVYYYHMKGQVDRVSDASAIKQARPYMLSYLQASVFVGKWKDIYP